MEGVTGRRRQAEHANLRNKKNWEANLKRSEQKAIDNSSNAATTAEDKEDSTEQSANGVTIDNDDGILGLVDGLPSDWAHHVRHNFFEVLTEKEEQTTQQPPEQTTQQSPNAEKEEQTTQQSPTAATKEELSGN